MSLFMLSSQDLFYHHNSGVLLDSALHGIGSLEILDIMCLNHICNKFCLLNIAAA